MIQLISLRIYYSKIRRLKKVLHEADKVWRETMDAAYVTESFMWSAVSPG